MSASTSFWDWAVAVYARPGVAEVCLDLQDGHDQNVPLLLWAFWAGNTGRQLEFAHMVALAKAWQEVIVPLRELRRRLKTGVTDGDDLSRLPLREQVKAAELAAEKALMDALERQSLEPKVDMRLMDRPGYGGRESFVRAGLLMATIAWNGQAPMDELTRLTSLLYAED